MNCAYHARNAAVVSCNGCGKPLCPACDHRIKGFPYCQDCIVTGVELLRNRDNSRYVPFVKRQTSPFLAMILSFICPGLGAAYNGQTSKALVYFAVFVALFQLAILTGTAIFVLGFIGMWLFAALDSWRTAQLIRSGITTDGAEDLLVKRISGNPKLWGIVLTFLGALIFMRAFFDVRFLLKAMLPVLLIGLGIYLLRDFVFRKNLVKKVGNFAPPNAQNFIGSRGETSFRTGEFETEYKTQPRV
ncbi:MAG: hypothetical protein ACR2LT_00205 [Pyrinomonadaceae bacterium]